VYALKAALRQIRINGYAINDEEHVLGVRAVAAPIFDYTGAVVASISLRGLVPRMPTWRMEHIGKEVAATSHEISRHLQKEDSLTSAVPLNDNCCRGTRNFGRFCFCLFLTRPSRNQTGSGR
jgi:hypothetical protein